MKHTALWLSAKDGGLCPNPSVPEPLPAGGKQMSPRWKHAWASPLHLVTRILQGYTLHSQAPHHLKEEVQLWSRVCPLTPARPMAGISSGLWDKPRKEAVGPEPAPECNTGKSVLTKAHRSVSDWSWALAIRLAKRKMTRHIVLQM